jgi:hypothetical protein
LRKRNLFFVGLLLMGVLLYGQDLRINELMSTNISIIADEDGAYVDWTEIFNPSDYPIELDGYTLSDDSLSPDKWTFPALSLGSGEYLLVFCSGKNRSPSGEHYETIIRRGDLWKYRMGDSEPPANWNTLGFDDSEWPEGESGFGYGDDDDNTEVEQTLSLYTRKAFEIESNAGIFSAILSIDFDDAFVAYLNGVEVARSHIGTPGTPPAFDDRGEDHEALMVQGMDPESFEIDHSLFVEGSNILAIQVHNAEWSSSDLSLIPYLTLVLDEAPVAPMGSPPELNLSGTGIHTSFNLSTGGEVLYLSDPGGMLLDSVRFGPIPGDISYGRKNGDPNTWLFFEEPTPGAPNGSSGFENVAEGELLFQPELKFFNGVISVSLSGNPLESVIRYTTDGSEPGSNSPEYEGVMEISASTIFRARIFQEGYLPGRIYSYNYIDMDDIDADNIPVIAISTDPYNLYNNSDGLFDNAQNRELEKPAHVEFVEPDGSIGFSIDAGLKIFGNEPTPGNHQHKLSIFARSKYGYGSINYHLFPDKPIKKFESIILRNEISEIWDVMASRLIDDKVVARQSYRPAIVFLNGEYWGTKFIREKINEHFVASNFGADPDSVDVIMGIESPVELYNEDWPIAGDLEDYKKLVHYLLDHDLTDPLEYEYISKWIDINNFITYQASEIYFGNIDWPGNNMKWWRERKENGIWRWILFDVDAGMGAWEGYQYNSMEHATKPDHDDQWPNPPWSTLILRTLLENPVFREQFIIRSFDLLNTDFKGERVSRELDILVEQTEGEIRNHMRRWDHGSYSGWEEHVESLRYWSRYRAERVKIHIRDFFDLGKIEDVSLNIVPHGSGEIRVNSRRISLFPWEGSYPEDFPVVLEAIPAYGYKFVGWEGIAADGKSISVSLEGPQQLTAVFEQENWYEPVVINEINYHPAPGYYAEDWVELYNNGTENINLSGWVLKDADDAHAFTIPQAQQLGAGEFLLVSRDKNLFAATYPDAAPVIGNLGFGLSGGGEMVRLFNQNQDLVDWVEYDDFTPWPMEPDGKGATLSLSHPDLDNSAAGSWFASPQGGTPGRKNEFTIISSLEPEQMSAPMAEPWPNPFKDLVHIHYRVEEAGVIYMAIYDLHGRMLDVLADGFKEAGEFSFTWNGAEYAPGVYLCVFRSGSFIFTKKLIRAGR